MVKKIFWMKEFRIMRPRESRMLARLPKTPLLGPENVKTEQEIGHGVGDHAGEQAAGAVGDEIIEGAGGEGRWPVWRGMLKAKRHRNDEERFPGKSAERDVFEVLPNAVTEKEASPEEFL